MLFAESFAPADDTRGPADRLRLPYEARRKSRQRVTLVSGEEMGYALPPGTVLRGGDRLLTGNGHIVEVEAARETLLEVRAVDALQLMRAAYHLGNRHVPVQLGEALLRLQPDHVLAEMLGGLGCAVYPVEAPFDPEGGAYGAGAHGTRQPYAHRHAHAHGHHPAQGGALDVAADASAELGDEPRSTARIHEFK